MLSFKQKIFITYVIIYLLLLAFMFPFGRHTVQKIINIGMNDRAKEIISTIQTAKDDQALIRMLKEQKSLVFFRISVITDENKVLYDSHTKRLLGLRFTQDHVVHHPEVMDAFDHGVGYSEGYSELLGQKFIYVANSFNFHGKTYVLRTAFPYKYVTELTRDFEIGFFLLTSALLLLFGLVTWLVINRLTAPIHTIIKAVGPYQEGIVDVIPTVQTLKMNRNDEFGKLAQTLNSLSEKVQGHINTLTRERNQKEAVLESLVEGVIAVDSQMVVTYANQTAIDLLEIPTKSIIGCFFNQLRQKPCDDLLTLCRKEKRILSEMLKLKGEKGKFMYNIVAVPQKDDSGAVLIIEDQTSLFKMLEMRKDFIANASHELKTPITIIRGFAETLHENPDLPIETRAEITDKISRSCVRMTKLIKDLLTLSDVENIPESRLIDCNVIAVIENCAAILREAYPKASIAVKRTAEQQFIINADPSLIEMAFLNLIENGIKYSNPPADLTITIESLPSDKVLIKVADRGIGIPQTDIEHLFERFYTVDKAHSKKLGGSGLGLSIVENIIIKHHGTIRVESQLGVGTTFFIQFPTT